MYFFFRPPEQFRSSYRRLHHVRRSATSGRDTSYTQFAVADDISAMQNVTRGGIAAMTLASRWQGSFDDSEETDHEMDENNATSPEQVLLSAAAAVAMLHVALLIMHVKTSDVEISALYEALRIN